MNENIFKASNGVEVKYKHKPTKYDFNHIIFVFSGFNNPLPGKYDFINALDNCPCDVIWISDDFEGMHSYYLCVNMDFKIEEAITEFIYFFIKKRNLTKKNVTVTGFSKGGSAALYYGLKLDITNIVATVPQIYIGDYLIQEWKEPAVHIMGIDYSKIKIQYLNNILPHILKKSDDLEKNIYLLTSEADIQYNSHIQPILPDLYKYSNFNLLKTYSLLVRQHNHVTGHHTSLLLSIYYALASEAIPRFNDGEVNFFGSQPIAKSRPSVEPFIDLYKITIVNDRLFLEGVALLRGVDVEKYSDINYELIFKGKNSYSKTLAKDNKPNLTREYFQKEIVIYDKCWFTTYKHQGLDISDIEKGKYQMYIKVRVREHEKTIELKSKKTIKQVGKNFMLDINDTSGFLTIN